MTSDTKAVKGLVRLSGIDVVKASGYPGLMAKYGKTGFNVTVEGRTLIVIPVP